MLWVVGKLNETQSDVLCVYINFVGKRFLGSDAQSGCHFSLAVFDSANNVMTYGDSFGWPIPVNLKKIS